MIELCDQKEEMDALAKQFLATTRNCFFIGRSVDFYVGLEGALKLKEIFTSKQKDSLEES